MTRILPVLALLLLAACQREEEATAPPTNSATEPAAPAPAAVPSLDGIWRVTKVDGRDIAGLGLVATIGGGQASLSAGCLRRAWTYSQQRNMVTFTSAPSASANCGGPPPAVADAAFVALDQANMVIFSADGAKADLSGTGGTLSLERR